MILPVPNLIVTALLVSAVYWLARPLIRGAVFFPTRNEKIKTVLWLGAVKPGDKVADLGSGDGRVLVAFAQAGIQAHGFEVDPYFVWKSRRKIRQAGLSDKAFVHWQSFWKIDLSQFDLVYSFCVPYFLSKLKLKLEKELKPGAKFISYLYPIEGWQAEQEIDELYLYRR